MATPGLVAVVSGGSSGIGFAVARILARKGYHIVLLAREQNKLETAKLALEGDAKAGVTFHSLDVADAVASDRVIKHVLDIHGRIDWLITSAGIAEPGMFIDLPSNSHRRQMEVNYFGTLNLISPVVAAMRKNGTGRITMISSAVAFGGIVGYSGYAPGKFAVRGLGETLRVELAPSGIAVSVAFPPDTQTPQYVAEQALRPEATKRISAGGGILTADKVAQTLVQGAEKGRFMLTPSWLMFLFGVFHSFYAPFLRHHQIGILRALEAENVARLSRPDLE